jgi:hypothetical protein
MPGLVRPARLVNQCPGAGPFQEHYRENCRRTVAASSPAEDRKLIRLIERLAKRQAAINRRYARLHPLDPPQRSCRYADA